MIEYGSDFLGPLPNVVIFQFNPESLTRTIQIPPRPSGGAARETTQAGEPSIEKISLKAQFSAADGMGTGNLLARTMGVGPRLAALEKMVNPASKLGGLLGAAIDAIGGALGLGGGGGDDPRQPIPREKYPRILFIWGPFRVLPVVIESMSDHRAAVRLPAQSDPGRRLDRPRGERHRQLLGRHGRQGRARVLEHGEGRAGDAEPRQHGRADRRTDSVLTEGTNVHRQLALRRT